MLGMVTGCAQVPETVAHWNVRRVALSREKRHADMTALLELYRALDSALAARRSKLAY
jgi:parafibromin